MLTKEEVAKAYDEGIVKIADGDPDKGCYGVVAEIGEYQFYFDGSEAEAYDSAEAYIADHTKDELADLLLSGIESIKEVNEDEYDYYLDTIKSGLAAEKQLGNVQWSNEYIAGGVVGTSSLNTFYSTQNGKYYAEERSYDDYADLPDDPPPYEVSYENIVKAFAEAVQHEDSYRDVYAGNVDAIADDSVTYRITDKKLEQDVMAYIDEQKAKNAEQELPKIISPELEAVLGDFALSINKSSDSIHLELSQYTPLSEDWHEEFEVTGNTVKELISEIAARYQDFDADAEAAVWIERRGSHDVPDSIIDLVKDAQWKESQLENMLTALRNEYLNKEDAPVLVDDMTSVIKGADKNDFSFDGDYANDTKPYAGSSDGRVYVDWAMSVPRELEDALFKRGGFQVEEDGEIYEADSLSDLERQLRKEYDDEDVSLYMEVFATIGTGNEQNYVGAVKDVSLQATLVMEGEHLDFHDIKLSYHEYDALIDRLNEMLKDTGKTVDDYLREAVLEHELEEAVVEEAQKELLAEFGKENFYDDDDIVKTYLHNATVQDVLDFTGCSADSVEFLELMHTANDIFLDLSPTAKHEYAEQYLPKLYARNIKGDKYDDSLDDNKQKSDNKKKNQVER